MEKKSKFFLVLLLILTAVTFLNDYSHFSSNNTTDVVGTRWAAATKWFSIENEPGSSESETGSSKTRGFVHLEKGINNIEWVPDAKVKPGRYVVAIMCIWDETFTLPMAIDSSRDTITEYIVVHKKGTENTLKVLEDCTKKWNLLVRYLESDMILAKARQWAIAASAKYADFYVIQDGDEVFYNSGPTALHNMFDVMGQYHNAIYSKMVYLKHDLKHTLEDSYKPGKEGKFLGYMANNIMLVAHNTIFRNKPNCVFFPSSLILDVPDACGPHLITHQPWKFDVSIKSEMREFLRQSLLDWNKDGSPGSIEEWTIKHSPIHLDYVKRNESDNLQTSARIFGMSVKKWLSPYIEDEYFPYPEAVKKYIDAGLFKGYEGGTIL